MASRLAAVVRRRVAVVRQAAHKPAAEAPPTVARRRVPRRPAAKERPQGELDSLPEALPKMAAGSPVAAGSPLGLAPSRMEPAVGGLPAGVHRLVARRALALRRLRALPVEPWLQAEAPPLLLAMPRAPGRVVPRLRQRSVCPVPRQ